MDWRGDYYSQAANVALAQGLTTAAEFLRAKSVPRAPVDTSAMRQTAQVTPATPNDLESGVSYDTRYSVRQHNDLTLQHWNGGEALFLERPLIEEATTIQKIIAKPLGDIQ